MKTTIIAEMACSHNGNINNAYKIAKYAYASKADIIQLQIWKLNYMMSPRNPIYNKLKKIEFSEQQWINLIKKIKKSLKGLKIYICFYEHNSFNLLNKVKVDGIKINTSDLNNYYLLESAGKSRLPINLSIGASTLQEISKSLKILKKFKSKINLLYGIQNFPTKIEDVNLKRLKYIKEKFKLNTGYQDHCEGNSKEGLYLPILALGYETSIIEKHICLNRSKTGFDFESALKPREFKEFVQNIRIAEKSIGTIFNNHFTKNEIKYRNFQKKNVVSTKFIKSGKTLNASNISMIRTGKNNSKSNNIEKIIGKKTKRNINPYTVITNSMLLKK